MHEFSLKFSHFASILDLAISSLKSASSALSIHEHVLARLAVHAIMLQKRVSYYYYYNQTLN